MIKEILIWLGVFIIGSLIVTFVVSPNSFNSFKNNMEDIIHTSTQGSSINVQASQDTLITQCKNSFNVCKNVIEKKYGLDVSINEIRKFEYSDLDEANEFVSKWYTKGASVKGIMVIEQVMAMEDTSRNTEQEFENKFPVVLIAFSEVKSETGFSMPLVAMCDVSSKLSISNPFFGC